MCELYIKHRSSWNICSILQVYEDTPSKAHFHGQTHRRIIITANIRNCSNGALHNPSMLSWQNGTMHCLATVSFALISPTLLDITWDWSMRLVYALRNCVQTWLNKIKFSNWQKLPHLSSFELWLSTQQHPWCNLIKKGWEKKIISANVMSARLRKAWNNNKLHSTLKPFSSLAHSKSHKFIAWILCVYLAYSWQIDSMMSIVIEVKCFPVQPQPMASFFDGAFCRMIKVIRPWLTELPHR